MIQIDQIKKPDAQLEKKLNECWRNILGRADVGFVKIVSDDAAWNEIDLRLRQCRPARRVLILGIGGSSLGTQAIYQSLGYTSPARFDFLESPDIHTWHRLGDLRADEWRDKHVVIVSKSGGTLETLAWVEWLAAQDRDFLKNSQCTVIASPGKNPLQI